MSDKLKARLKKLLAMINPSSGASATERETAERHLAYYLAKHNLHIENIQDDDRDDDDKIEDEKIKATHTTFKSTRKIAWSLGHLYFCKIYSVKVTSGTFYLHFVGTQINRTIAMELYKSIVSTVKREARIECQRQLGRATGKDAYQFKSSFWMGAADRIQSRCMAMRKEAESGDMKSPDGKTNLPALLSVYEKTERDNAKFLLNEGIVLRTRQSRTSYIQDGDAFGSGTAVGNRVALNRSIASNAPKALPRL